MVCGEKKIRLFTVHGAIANLLAWLHDDSCDSLHSDRRFHNDPSLEPIGLGPPESLLAARTGSVRLLHHRLRRSDKRRDRETDHGRRHAPVQRRSLRLWCGYLLLGLFLA